MSDDGHTEGMGAALGAETRKLAAIMFTDMVGFSSLMHEDEEKGLGLLDESNRVISQVVEERNGRVLKRMGDAVLAEFSSATSAVACAVDIQTRLRDRNAAEPPHSQIVLRIGIHLGDVVIRDQDLFGDGINVAARLEPLCEPGGVCLSEAVYQAIASSSSLKPVLVGEIELKNILQRQVIYRIPSFYGEASDETLSPRLRTRSLSFGSVGRVEILPAPNRSFMSMLALSMVTTPLGVGAGLLFGVALNPPQPYRIYPWEILEPVELVSALQRRTDPAQTRILESLDRNTREAITGFEASEAGGLVESRTARLIRRSFNTLIAAEQPILDEALVAGLSEAEAASGDLRRLNRALLEAAFPGMIQRHVGEPSRGTMIARVFPTLLSELRILFVVTLVTILFVVVWSAYYASLKTLRIYFDDIREVDALLDYYIQDLGFRESQRAGDELVFRATFWTWLRHTVLKIRARVSGNMVVLTGPSPMMKRLRERMLLFAEGAH